MRWPFVSRVAFDAVCQERDYLRTQLERERDHSQRIERVQAGLGELAPKPRKVITAMPKAVQQLINAYDNPEIRRDVAQRAYNRVKQGGTWEQVEELLKEAQGLEVQA